MPEPQEPSSTPRPLSDSIRSSMFAEPVPGRSFPTTAVAIAGAAIVILTAALVMMGHRHTAPTNTLQPLAAYAPNLALTNIEMSESTSLSGGKSTYIDGHIANHGASTVTGVTVQVLFASDGSSPPQLETTPLRLIRIRDPEIDTQAVSAAPLAPGGEADFRLIFEDVSAAWNQQQPEIHVIQVGTR